MHKNGNLICVIIKRIFRKISTYSDVKLPSYCIAKGVRYNSMHVMPRSLNVGKVNPALQNALWFCVLFGSTVLHSGCMERFGPKWAACLKRQRCSCWRASPNAPVPGLCGGCRRPYLPEGQHQEGQQQETPQRAPNYNPDGDVGLFNFGDLKCNLEGGEEQGDVTWDSWKAQEVTRDLQGVLTRWDCRNKAASFVGGCWATTAQKRALLLRLRWFKGVCKQRSISGLQWK